MRKGQAAIEYLIILAVVVIIALIVIGVIGGFPGMTRGISERDSAAYWAAADVGITRYYVSAGGADTKILVLKNNRPFTINVTSIYFGSMCVACTAMLSVGPLTPGSSAKVVLEGDALDPYCQPVGSTWSYITVINYKDLVYGTTYKFTGEKPLVGTCQPP